MSVHQWPLITVALLGSLLLGCQNTAGEQRPPAMDNVGKPSAPISVRIEPDDPVRTPGEIVDFRITTASSVAIPELELTVDVPDSLAVYSGDRYWLGPLPAGGRHELVLAIRIPEQGGQRITAAAVARFGDGHAMMAQDVFILGSEQRRPAGPASRETTHDGQAIREYQLP